MLTALKTGGFRRWGIIAILVVVLLVAGQIFLSGKVDGMAIQTKEKVVSIIAAETVAASGSLEAQPFAALTWNTSGVVEEVRVKAGDRVRAGDVLMTLNAASVDAGVLSAQSDLATAQKDLEDLLISSDADLAQAVIDLKDARQAYDEAVDYLKYLQTSQKVPQTEAKIFIEETRGKWKYRYKTRDFKGPAPQDWITDAENDLALKKAKLEDAQRAHDRLKDGPDARDVTIAQARIDAARATVNSMSIIAPFDGQVLYVVNRPGDLVGIDSAALHLANLDHLYLEAQVSESDIGSVKVGNPATATLEAAPGVELTGHVAGIDPLGEEVSGLVQYTVRIDIDEAAANASLPLGSTANVAIRVKEAAPSLAVPLTVIQNDSQGEYVWVVQEDGSAKRVDVVSGTIAGEFVTVSGDLREGDTLMASPTGGGNAGLPKIGSGFGRMLR